MGGSAACPFTTAWCHMPVWCGTVHAPVVTPPRTWATLTAQHLVWPLLQATRSSGQTTPPSRLQQSCSECASYLLRSMLWASHPRAHAKHAIARHLHGACLRHTHAPSSSRAHIQPVYCARPAYPYPAVPLPPPAGSLFHQWCVTNLYSV